MQEADQRLSSDDELFCKRYEDEIVSGIINHNRLERWLPGFCSPHTHKEHEARYNWVKQFVNGKTVLDIACGTGFGSRILAKQGNAIQVTGWDIDANTVRYASLRNKDPRLVFAVRDAESFDNSQEFDIIISFETIEHLKRPERFLQNISGALKKSGTCFVSTPISSMSENKAPDNLFHTTEWGFKKFHELASTFLNIDEIYLQVYKVAPASTGIISRLLRRAGFKKEAGVEAVNDLIPFKWQPEQLKEELVGSYWTGYQILQCSQKADAGS